VPGIGEQASDAVLWGLGPRVTMATIEGVGQLPHDEAPDRVLALIDDWPGAGA
jgi:hypothetical protein